MDGDRRFAESNVLGEVEMGGVRYRIVGSSGNELEVVRCTDDRSVGRLRGSPSVMWRVEAQEIDKELLRAIVRRAIEEGLLVDLPSD